MPTTKHEFKKGDKVELLEVYHYGPQHIKVGQTFTVKRVDKNYVYVKEVYAGRYGFYPKRFKKL